MKKLVLICAVALHAGGASATCTVTLPRCTGVENCSGAYCTKTYIYSQASCRCTDYCECETFPAGFDSRTCKCMASPGGGTVACR